MTDRWICLLYHDVMPRRPALCGGSTHFAVSQSAFERQLDAIVEAGLAGCSIEAALSAPGQRRVAISFDDGDVGQFERAFPSLVERNMSATFLVTSSWVGRPGYMSWDQLREMKGAGMSIQSHTVSHPFLSELAATAVLDELRRSKGELDERLVQDTGTLALPGGDMPRRRLRPLIEQAGYRIVATSRWGSNLARSGDRDGPIFVRRCTIRAEPSKRHFCGILNGDPRLAVPRATRDLLLRSVRSTLGASRYAGWRRRFLEVLAR